MPMPLEITKGAKLLTSARSTAERPRRPGRPHAATPGSTATLPRRAPPPPAYPLSGSHSGLWVHLPPISDLCAHATYVCAHVGEHDTPPQQSSRMRARAGGVRRTGPRRVVSGTITGSSASMESWRRKPFTGGSPTFASPPSVGRLWRRRADTRTDDRQPHTCSCSNAVGDTRHAPHVMACCVCCAAWPTGSVMCHGNPSGYRAVAVTSAWDRRVTQSTHHHDTEIKHNPGKQHASWTSVRSST